MQSLDLCSEVIEALLNGVEVKEDKNVFDLFVGILGNDEVTLEVAQQYFSPLLDGKKCDWDTIPEAGQKLVILPECAGGF